MTLAPPPAAPALLADLRARAFGIGAPRRPRRIGAEVELLALRADTRAPAPVEAAEGPATLPLLRRHGARHGWTERSSPYGPPCFVLPDGGVVSYEPGGQLEVSAPPFASASALLASLRRAVLPLRSAAREEGIELLAAGIDPVNPAEAAPLRLCGARYLRMAEHFAAIGPHGARMMRQTASVQVNLDWPADPLPLWRVLNAAAPYLTAIFAGSPVYAGAPTGHRSTRAHAWRELDPARTGALPPGGDPAAGYLRFALDAPAILLPWPAGRALPAAEWLARGEMTEEEWRAHLSTLFPEVRPRGYAEVRSIDALDPGWYAAPLALLSGIAYQPEALRAASELLPDPEPELLRRAGREGMGDAEVARVARDLFAVGLEGAAALGEAFLSAADLETAVEFYRRYTRRDRSPADDASPGG